MNINVAQAYWFFAGKIVIEQISTKSVKSGCPHFPTIKWRCSEMFVILPKFSCYLCLSDLELKKISAVPWRTAYPSVAQGGRSCKSPKAAWCRLKDQIRWALLCLQPTEESHVFFHSLRCLSISCHVVMSSWKLPPPPSFTYRQQLCLSGKRAAGGSQFEGKSTWDAEGLWCPRSSAWKPCD